MEFLKLTLSFYLIKAIKFTYSTAHENVFCKHNSLLQSTSHRSDLIEFSFFRLVYFTVDRFPFGNHDGDQLLFF